MSRTLEVILAAWLLLPLLLSIPLMGIWWLLIGPEDPHHIFWVVAHAYGLSLLLLVAADSTNRILP